MVAVQEMVFTTKTNRQYRVDLTRHAADSFACQVTQHSEPTQDLVIRSTGVSALEAFEKCVAMLKAHWEVGGADELVSVDNPSNTELLNCADQSLALKGAVQVRENGADLLANLFDALASLSKNTVVELPKGKKMAPGRQVELKYKWGLVWPTVAKGHWVQCDTDRHQIEGGFRVDLVVEPPNIVRYDISAKTGNKTRRYKGTANVVRSSKCDDCNNGSRSNQSWLVGTTENGDHIEVWPKSDDRVRIVFEKKDSKVEIEIDTK